MHHPTRLHMLFHSHACLPFCVTPLLKQLLPVLEYQPVVHLLRSLPRIRSRLTLRRRSLLRNPYAFGGKDSHLSFRYSYQHSHFPQVHRTFQFDFYPMGTLPYPVCVFAECCVFDKQSVGPFLCGLHRCRHPFFRSYGANLPSSLTRFHSYALVYSTHPPVSVCGTGRLAYAGAFLGTRSNDALSP